MARHMVGKKSQQRGKKPKRFHHTSDQSRHKLEVKRWQLEEEEAKCLKSQYESINPEGLSNFADLPLSVKTKAGLRMVSYKVPTEIQRATIGLALQGNDILGAAKTGSGKTLAFLIPILECLYRSRWSKTDGLGALIISPTRELAYQTFEVLCKIGKKHDFSAALIIGGKDVKSEMERISRTNIVVCTPGRFLQHLDQAMGLDCSNLQILVLDEADRILDMGFEKTMNAILENLPTERQTLLFSATQTKSVRDLARLSLKDPKYVAVHQHHEYSTPAQLEQSYVVCELEQKIDLLYSFIRNHTKHKILVFMASCKQVKYTFEIFCALHPGTTVMALYGTLHQLRRVSIYDEFCKRDAAVLFATDIAARGLDFPAVNWVLQLDCPEDASTYIHRVGRTARYEQGGESLLILLPSEEDEMIKQLQERKIPVQKINVNPNRKLSTQTKLMSLCAGSQELKESAQRCFINYVKSVYLMKNKKVFDVNQLPLEKYSFSLGLAIAPRVRFLQRENKRKEEQEMMKRQKHAKNRELLEDQSRDDDDSAVKTVLKQHRRGPDLVMEEQFDTNEMASDGLDAIVEKLKSTASGRTKDGANIKLRTKEDLLEDEEIKRMEGKREGKLEEHGKDKKLKVVSSRDETDVSKKKTTLLEDDSKVDNDLRIVVGKKGAQGKSGRDLDDDSDQSELSSEGDSGNEHSEKPEKVGLLGGDRDGDGEEDFLIVKKKDVFGITQDKQKHSDPADETVEESKRSKKSKKPLSKAAQAKKLRRMKITVNTKKVFDDEGQVVQQWPPVQRTIVPDNEQPIGGGIDIEKAKEWMRQEDQYDKQAFRERIRAKHKAERLKAKEGRRKFSRRRKEEEEDDEDDDDVGITLDLGDDYVPFDPDTLPDPDRYADESGTDQEVETTPKKKTKKKKTKVDIDDEMPKKRKGNMEGRTNDKKKRKKSEKKDLAADTELTLQDDEDLALHILSSSRF